MDPWTFTLYLRHINPKLRFCCWNYFSFGHWEPFLLVLYPFDMGTMKFNLLIFEHFFNFCHCKILQAHLVTFPMPAIESTLCSKQLWFLLLEKHIRNQKLGTKCTCCYWNVIAKQEVYEETHLDR